MPRALQWALIAASLIYALLYARFEWGGVGAYVLALLPAVLTYLVTGTWLAAAFMVLLPMYFVIGQWTAAAPHYQPFIWLDHAMPLRPAWIAVYASLYMCAFMLPLVVVRGHELFRQAMKAYLFVMVVSYLGFWFYPTVAPLTDKTAVSGFAEWSLQLFYDLDQPYGCFPSLHVAYSFVGALACYRMHRGVGITASVWSVLIGLSTVYTKQHFVVDAIAGAGLGITSYWLFLNHRPREAVDETDRRLAPLRSVYVMAAYLAAIGAFWTAYQLGLGTPSH
ncbi:MAG TPA: phosphatase PAP2 family protein [Vicinamibacterales bacterium]|nr:phosphatase PAP2 family protein [Vicinamibacterales bacterium]